MSKSTEDKELQEAKKEHDRQKAIIKARANRAKWFLAAILMLATPIYLGIMVDSFGLINGGNINIGQSALVAMNVVASIFCITKAIE